MPPLRMPWLNKMMWFISKASIILTLSLPKPKKNSSFLNRPKCPTKVFPRSIPLIWFLKWQKPPPSSFNVNWDVACDHKKEKLCLVAIILNFEGKVIGSLRATRSFNNLFSIEAFAFLMMVQFCKDSGINHFRLEGDTLQVVNRLVKGDAD